MDSPSNKPVTGAAPKMNWRCVDCGGVHSSDGEICPFCGAPRSAGLKVTSDHDELYESKVDAVTHSTPGGRPARCRLTLLSIVLVFSLGNLFLGPIARSLPSDDAVIVFMFALVGTVFAQFGLLAIWCVLAPVEWPRRFAYGAGFALWLYASWAIGFAGAMVAERHISAVDLQQAIGNGLLCLPIILLGVQLPLWVARISLHWRILHNSDLMAETWSSPVGIRHIIVATVIVAVALSASRFLAVIHDVPAIDVLAPLLIWSLIAAAISLFSTISIVFATLRAKNVWPALFLALLLHGGVLITFVVVLSIIAGSGPQDEIYGYLFALLVGFFGSFVAAMALMRRLGYRLYWGRDEA